MSGNSLLTSLKQSGIDISHMPELSAIAKSVKSVGIQSLGELISLVELLNTSLLQEKVLVIIDGFQILLLAQKVHQD